MKLKNFNLHDSLAVSHLLAIHFLSGSSAFFFHFFSSSWVFSFSSLNVRMVQTARNDRYCQVGQRRNFNCTSEWVRDLKTFIVAFFLNISSHVFYEIFLLVESFPLEQPLSKQVLLIFFLFFGGLTLPFFWWYSWKCQNLLFVDRTKMRRKKYFFGSFFLLWIINIAYSSCSFSSLFSFYTEICHKV